MTDPVREEMIDILVKWEGKLIEDMVNAKRATFVLDDLLRVIERRTFHARCGISLPQLRVCDTELTHTLDSVPEEVKSVSDKHKQKFKEMIMKPHYFHQEQPDKDDFMLRAAKGQGYVPKDCLLGGAVVMGLVNEGKDPCRGCECDREKCGGRR